jgi:putative SOS response-associated peptidase YedK
MCVQYKVQTEVQSLLRHLRARQPQPFEYREHVFPRYTAPVVTWEEGGRVLRPMNFGLIPFFEQAAKPKRVFHNARSETIAEKPSFKRALVETRCLVPLNGFFEYIWDTETTNWLAWFTPEDQRLLVAAAVWNPWRAPDGGRVDGFAIVTRDPPESISRVGHDRSPVFLQPDAWDAWLDPAQRDPAALQQVLTRVDPITFVVERVAPPPRRAGAQKASRAQADTPPATSGELTQAKAKPNAKSAAKVPPPPHPTLPLGDLE